MCKLSVIIPVYNTCAALPRCIESVLGQDFSDFELLLIDDGSTDDSGKVCDAYAEKDSRVKTFHKTRGGPSSARNIGLDNATGEWVTFIDSDDYVDAGYLSLPYSDDVDLYVRNWNFAKSNALEHFDSTFVDNEHYWGFLQERMYGFAFRTACCSFFKRALIEQGRIRFDEGFRLGEDTLFVLDYYPFATTLQIVDGSLYRYDRSQRWEDKHRLSWDEAESYLSVFMDKYGKLPIEVPTLTAQMLGLFRAQIDKREGNVYCKWLCSEPVHRMIRSQTVHKKPLEVAKCWIKAMLPIRIWKTLRWVLSSH